jgi:hypothetical protein
MMVKCWKCEEEFDYEEEGYAWQGAHLCEECHKDEEFECCRCGEHADIEDEKGLPIQDTYLVIFRAREAGLPRRGVYEIVRWPYVLSPMIGQASVFDDCLRRIKEIAPFQPTHGHDYAAGHLCEDCQKALGLDRSKTGAYIQQKEN